MTDREALEAALNNDKPDEFTSVEAQYEIVATAARERLAQLPEKCELKPEDHASGVVCPGYLYSPALVERLSRALFTAKGVPEENWSRLVPVLAVVVLDALNGETE